MAISVSKLTAPVITITGSEIFDNVADPLILSTITASTKITKAANSNSVSHPSVRKFLSDSVIRISTDYPTPTYTSADFKGKKAKDGMSVNNSAEIYYTVNGKDPIRTKAYLYTADISGITLKENTSGDNIILKAKVYYKGQESEVAITEFKIVKTSIRYADDEVLG